MVRNETAEETVRETPKKPYTWKGSKTGTSPVAAESKAGIERLPVEIRNLQFTR